MDYQLLKFKINNSYDYPEYKNQVQCLVDKGQCTGPNQSADKINFTKLNLHRMKRAEKQFQLDDQLANTLQNIQTRWTWIVLTESWCGDASHNLPVIAKIAEQTQKIDLIIILRDEHPEIMNEYLTNGAMAIPRMICFDTDSGEELGVWGPRPQPIKMKMSAFKSSHPDASHDEFLQMLHLTYGRDKGQTIKKELTTHIDTWTKYQSTIELHTV